MQARGQIRRALNSETYFEKISKEYITIHFGTDAYEISYVGRLVPVLRVPSPADVVGRGENHENGEKKEGTADYQADHFGGILHVHKEEDDQGSLGGGNEECDDRIENAEIAEGYPCRHACQDEQDDPDSYVDFG
jgi:hypothetical protein